MNCLLCKQPLQPSWSFKDYFSFREVKQEQICDSCKEQFVRIDHPTCVGCGRMDSEPNVYCKDCVRWKECVSEEWISHDALYSYNDAFADWLYAYKFQGDVRMAVVFQEALQKERKKHLSQLIVPIPISNASYTKRGFNQCEIILETAGIPYTQLLSNRSSGKKQADKNRFERLQSSQPFELLSTDRNFEQPILLFDDVYTTGRTLLHAKACLAAAGYKNLSSMSLAR